MSSSVDEDLARSTSQLSMGASIVSDLNGASCVLPKKLYHLALYNNSMGDVSMNGKEHDNNRCGSYEKMAGRGVPGFPDFPDCWQGETSSAHNNNNKDDVKMGNSNKNRSRQKWKLSTRQQRRRRQMLILRRNAVNTQGINANNRPASGNSKEVKKKSRDERRLRRIAKVAELKARRRRKRDMGDICRGMASIKTS